jgi:hypothetical protein
MTDEEQKRVGLANADGIEGLTKSVDHSRLPGYHEQPHNLFPPLPEGPTPPDLINTSGGPGE